MRSRASSAQVGLTSPPVPGSAPRAPKPPKQIGLLEVFPDHHHDDEQDIPIQQNNLSNTPIGILGRSDSHTEIPSTHHHDEGGKNRKIMARVNALAGSLAGLGFDGAFDFILAHGYLRVEAAYGRVMELLTKGTALTNPPGRLRKMGTSGPPAGASQQEDPNKKYVTGRYGQYVRR